MVTAENVERLNGEIQYVSLDQSGFLSLYTLDKGRFKKAIRLTTHKELNVHLLYYII